MSAPSETEWCKISENESGFWTVFRCISIHANTCTVPHPPIPPLLLEPPGLRKLPRNRTRPLQPLRLSASAPAPASRPHQNAPRRVQRVRGACGSHEQYMTCGCQQIVVAAFPGHCFKTSNLSWLWGAELNSAIEPRSAFLYAECMLYYNLLSRFGGISKFQ